MNQAEIENLCGHLGIAEHVDEVLDHRNNLVESMAQIPEYAAELGMDAFSPDMDHVLASIKLQSEELERIVEASVEEARNERINGKSVELESSSSIGMGM